MSQWKLSRLGRLLLFKVRFYAFIPGLAKVNGNFINSLAIRNGTVQCTVGCSDFNNSIKQNSRKGVKFNSKTCL